MEWIRRSFEGNLGRMGYKDFYAIPELNLRMLDPEGAVCEDWRILNAWIQNANFGELDYSVSDPVNITLTIRFDQAELIR